MNEQKTKKLWFKRKRYGWGWMPSTWQGWVVLMFYVILITDHVIAVDFDSISSGDLLTKFIPKFLLITLALIFICYLKGEKPRWSWGE